MTVLPFILHKADAGLAVKHSQDISWLQVCLPEGVCGVLLLTR